MRSYLYLFFLIVMIVLVSACSNDSIDEQANDEKPESTISDSYSEASVCELAESEPDLLWYYSETDEGVENLLSKFSEYHPNINVKTQRFSSGDLAVRYESERENNIDTATLVSIADTTWVKSGIESGWFEELNMESMPELENFPSDYVLDDHGLLTGITIWNIGYNTSLFPEEPDNDWNVLIDPDNKGNILLQDPSNLPSLLALMDLWRESYGEEFLKKLSDQDITWVDSAVPGAQQLAAGQKGLLVPGGNSWFHPLMDEGAPIDMVIPDLTVGNEAYAAISNNSESKNAAKCLLNYIASEEGQIIMNDEDGTSRYSAYGDIGSLQALPDNYQSPDLEKLPEVRDEVLDLLGLN